MPQCECLAGCPFFNDKMQNMPSAATLMKKRLCLGDNTDCARHMIVRTKGRSAVPAELSPNSQDKARAIIGS